MKLEDQVLSIGQMQHLKELGVEVKDTALAWAWFTNIPEDERKYRVMINDKETSIFCQCSDATLLPTLTLQEIWQMLPKTIEEEGERYELLMEQDKVGYFSWYCGELNSTLVSFYGDDSLYSLYQMLCWVLGHKNECIIR